MERYKFGVFQFVLTDKRFSFLDRLFYFGFILIAALAVYFLVISFWVSLEFNVFAFGILLVLLFFAPKIRTKFTDPYVLLTKGVDEMKFEREMALKTMELSQKVIPVTLKANIAGGAVGLGVMAVIFGTIFFFHFLGFDGYKSGLSFLLPIVLAELIFGVYLLIKVINKSFKPLSDSASGILNDERISLKQKLIAILILLIIFGLAFYRIAVIGQL